MTPLEDPDPRFDGQVWFCQNLGRMAAGAQSQWAPWGAGISTSHLFIFGAAILAAVAVMLVRATGVSPRALWWASLAGMAVLAFMGLRFWLRHYRENRTASRIPFGASPRHRVQCAVTDAIRARIEPLTDQAFEPEVFNASLALAGHACPRWVKIVVAVVSVAGVLTVWFLTTGTVKFLAPMWLFFAVVAYALWAALMSQLWPVELRIVPGRLDIIHSGFLGLRRRPLIYTYNLRRARVYVSIRTKWACIVDGPRVERIPFAAIPQRERFARYLLLAAISTAEAPEMPRDELVG